VIEFAELRLKRRTRATYRSRMVDRGPGRWGAVAMVVVWLGSACGSSKGKPPPEPGSGSDGAVAPVGLDAAAAPRNLPTFDQIVSTATTPTQIASLVAQDPGQLAWIMFLYANWPATPGKRGVPDPTLPLGATPTVWQTWKEVHEVYLAGGAAPLPWDDGGPKGPPTLSLGEIDGTTLEDESGNPIMYTVTMNQGTFDYLVSRALYSWNGQAALRSTGAAPVAFPASAMEVKASWIVLDPVNDKDRIDHYLLAEAIVPPNGMKVTVGLTGLHLTSKALPNWVWITFEQIENATTTGVSLKLPIDPGIAQTNAMYQKALAGTPYAYYQANGVQTTYTTAEGAATLLANTQIETKFQTSSSCITCHALASVSTGKQPRLDFFQLKAGNLSGFTGAPPTTPFGPGPDQFSSLDFVWSMREAKR
jgi:hypothetical protein